MWLSTMPCVSRRVNGSSMLHEAHVAHHLGPEARVEQVQDRVLDAADVLVHRVPVVVARIDHRRRVGARVAHVVPRRVDERVHRVGLALRRLAALAGRRVSTKSARFASGLPLPSGTQSSGSTTGRSFSGTGTSPQRGAVDDRDRRAPVALARDAPVAQAVRRLLLAQALGREVGGDRVDGGVVGEAVVLAGVDAAAALLVLVPGLPRVGRRTSRRRSAITCLIGSPYFLREREVALVVRRHAHHRAVAVAPSARSCRPRPRSSRRSADA